MYYFAVMPSRFVARGIRAAVCLAIVGLLGVSTVARADGFGLISGGDEAKQPVVETELGPWLRDQGKADVRVGAEALEPAQIKHVVDCFIIADQACAQQAVASGDLAGLMFVMVEVERDAASAGDRIKITGWLYGPGGAPIAAQSLVCNDCRNDTLKPKLQELARLLFAAASTGAGRLTVVTRPSGATVLVDGEKIGISPVTRGLREGPHTITLELLGHKTVTRPITIMNDAESPLDVAMVSLGRGGGGGGGGGGKLLGYGLVAVGSAAVVGGAAMILLDPRCDVGSDAEACAVTEPTYTSTQLPGLVAAGAGAVAVAVGVYLITRSGKRSGTTPVASVSAGGAVFGLTGSF